MLNHCGGPVGINAYKRDEVFPGWKKSIEALAKRPNVYVKLGGLGMRIGGLRLRQASPIRRPRRRWPTRGGPTSRPASRRSGPSRGMFESNFPVDKGSYSYPVFWNACKILAKGASAAEKADLFVGAAKRFYKLDGIAW